MSYAVAVGYVLVDTGDKGIKAYALAQQELGANAALHAEVDTPRCEACCQGCPVLLCDMFYKHIERLSFARVDVAWRAVA